MNTNLLAACLAIVIIAGLAIQGSKPSSCIKLDIPEEARPGHLLFLMERNDSTIKLEFERSDYQVELETDSFTVWSNGTHIGTLPYGNSPIDSLFIKDNE